MPSVFPGSTLSVVNQRDARFPYSRLTTTRASGPSGQLDKCIGLLALVGAQSQVEGQTVPGSSRLARLSLPKMDNARIAGFLRQIRAYTVKDWRTDMRHRSPGSWITPTNLFGGQALSQPLILDKQPTNNGLKRLNGSPEIGFLQGCLVGSFGGFRRGREG
jgi:hypothetical protein